MKNALYCLIFSLLACIAKNAKPDAAALRTTHFQPADLLESPGKKGKVIRKLAPGEQLSDLDETSRFVTPLKVGDSTFQSPWLKIKTSGGETGWVFSAAVEPVFADFETWRRRKLADCFLGKNISRNLTGWANAIENAQTDEDFAENFRQGLRLRDSIAQILERLPEPSEPGFQPDFFWLNEAMPGFVLQMVADGTRPWLFADFKFFQKIAAQTDGKQDDAFLQAAFRAFPTDSIESFFPAWTIQTDDQSGSSQLGTGNHLECLVSIGNSLREGDFFAPELLNWKDKIEDDIMNQNTTFWQPKHLIVKELRDILALKFSPLTERDRLALTERLRILENAEVNGVLTNLRAGHNY